MILTSYITLILIMDSKEKEKLINKARKLGAERFKKYSGCGQTTLYAIADTLRARILMGLSIYTMS